MIDPKNVPFRFKLILGVVTMVALTAVILAGGILFMLDHTLGGLGLDPALLAGVERRLLLVAALIVVAGVAGALLGSFILVRILIRPLRQLSAYTLEVAAGNYGAAIDYPARDAIGETIDAVRNMTVELKTRLGMSQGLLTSLTQPCVVVDTDEVITFLNQAELDLLQIDEPPSSFIGMPWPSSSTATAPGRPCSASACARTRSSRARPPRARAARAAPTTCWWTSRPSRTWTATWSGPSPS